MRYSQVKQPVATIAGVNNELEKIANSIDDMVSRKAGDGPNTLDATLDANSQRIINLPEPETNTEPVRKADFDELGNKLRSDVYTAVRDAEDATDDAIAAANSANAAASNANSAADNANIAADNAYQAIADLESDGYAVISQVESYGHNVISQLESDGQSALDALRVINAGSFEAGGTITTRNEALLYEAEQTFYRWDGDLPKTVPAGSTPATTGGVGAGAWVNVGQAELASALADAADSANRVARMAITADSLKDLATAPRIANRQYSVKGFYAGSDVGGGMFYWDATRDKAEHNGGTVIDPDRIGAWDGTQGDLSTLFTAAVSGSGCFIRINNTPTAVKGIDVSWFGALEDTAETIDSRDSFNQAFIAAQQEKGRVTGSGDYYLASGDIETVAECDLSQTKIVTNADYVGDIFAIVQFSGRLLKFGDLKANGSYHLNASAWSIQNSCIGYKSGPITDKLIEFNTISNYWAGLRIQPDTGIGGSQFFAYNTVRGLSIFDCKYNLMINPIAGGWVNQNLWDIRRIRNNSSSANGWGIYCVKDYLPGGATPSASPNENIFFNICLEGNGPNCIYSVNSYNSYIDCRFEARPAGAIVFDSNNNFSANNRIIGGYGLNENMIEVVNGRGPLIIHQNKIALDANLKLKPAVQGADVVLSAENLTKRNADGSPQKMFDATPSGFYFYTTPATGVDAVRSISIGVKRGMTSLFSARHDGAISDYGTELRFFAPINLYEANIHANPSSNRLAPTKVGQQMFDTTLGKPIWWNGTAWVDATGVAV